MGCPGCLPDVKELQQQLISVAGKAKQFAIENECTAVVYKDDEGCYRYMEAEAARAAGVHIVQFISGYQPVTDVGVH